MPGYSALLAKRVAADLTSLVARGEAPARTFTVELFYGIVDALWLLILGLQARNLLRLKQQGRRRWLRFTRAALNIGIALLIGIGMPLSGGMTWDGMFLFHPDLALLLALTCSISLVTGVLRLLPAAQGAARR